MFRIGIYIIVSASCASFAVAGPIWPEAAAGRVPATAETVLGGSIMFINGSLSGTLLRGAESPDFEDMYLIRIQSQDECGRPFSASTSWNVQPGGINDFNTQLWLFDSTGRGLLGNDDAALGVPQSFITFPATDATLQPFPGAGLYYLAITGFNNDPLSMAGPIFNQVLPDEISGPDGPGAPLPIIDWTGDGDIGHYSIRLECVVGVPEPASGLLLLTACGALVRRRPVRR